MSNSNMCSRRLRSAKSDQIALYHQQDLEQRLNTLITYTERYYAPGMKAELRLAQADARAISKCFSDTVVTRLYNERRPKDATDIAARAFAMPEILEMILDELNRDELLQSQLVCCQFRDTIKASPLLGPQVKPPRYQVRRRNAPQINIHGHVRGVEWRRRCRLCREARDHYSSRFHRHCVKEVWAAVENCKRLVPSRCLSMQVCEPPIFKMGIWIDCCAGEGPWADGYYTNEPNETISNEHGLTLGDLLDRARKLQTAHASCDHSHGEDEYRPSDMTSVRGVVTFVGDHGFVCEGCSRKYDATWDPDYDPEDEQPDYDSADNWYPQSDDDQNADENDEEYKARLLTDRDGTNKKEKP